MFNVESVSVWSFNSGMIWCWYEKQFTHTPSSVTEDVESNKEGEKAKTAERLKQKV